MPQILLGQQGEVIKFSIKNNAQMAVTIKVENSDESITSALSRILFASVNANESSRSSVMYSADDRIFINSFGDNLGTANISGTAYIDRCNPLGGESALKYGRDLYGGTRLIGSRLTDYSHLPKITVSQGNIDTHPLIILVNSFKSQITAQTPKCLNFEIGGYLLPLDA